MIKAVIDVGSNSIKMRVAEVSKGRVRVIRDETEVVKLGRGMSSTGLLSDESMKLSCDTVSKMVHKARHIGQSKTEIFIAGTMALRTAQNSSKFLEMVKAETGLDVHVLTGMDEAKFSWLGASEGFRITGGAVMFDSGGGSTEFVAGSGREMKRAVSVPIGAVNLSERFFSDNSKPVKKSECDTAVEYLCGLFTENGIESFRPEKDGIVIAVGGGVAAMSCVKCASEEFIPSKLHGSILTLKDVARQIRLYSSLTLSERENIIGLPKSRADVILGSACIVFAALKTLDAPSCVVSINGLRHGLLVGDI